MLPEPVALPMPPGDPEALADLVQDVAAVAFRLTVLGERLTGPAARAPGWIGADAAAAADQIGRVAALTRDAGNAVLEVTGRLSAHAGCLREARQVVSRLRREQDEDFRAARRRIGQIEDLQLAVMTASPAWTGVIDEIEAGEAARRRRHELVVREVEDDAAATAHVLARVDGVVGGTGVRGDADRVTAHLAAELPGWGDLETTRLGREAAAALVGQGDFDDLEAAARSVLAYARSAPFADALLTALGIDGVRRLLSRIGWSSAEGTDDVAGLLATALGGASTNGPAADVLGAVYLPTGDEGSRRPSELAGMAAVLAASRSLPPSWRRPATVAAWARQLLLWEHENGYPGTLIPPGWGPALHDPAAIALGILAESADPAVCAELFGDVRIWQTSLARFWPDDGEALAAVVSLAGQEPGMAGARAVRNGLVVVGAEVVEGAGSEYLVTQRTVAVVSFALGSGVAAHAPVVAPALVAAASGRLPDFSRDLLRGLGIASTSGRAAAMIEDSLNSWIAAQPPVGDGVVPPAVSVPSAYGAALNYGYRLPWVLEEEARRDDAAAITWVWDHSVDVALVYLKRPVVGVLAQAAADWVAEHVGADGTWAAAADPGEVVTLKDAVNAAVFAMDPQGSADQTDVNSQAFDSVYAATRVIGYPQAPVPPGTTDRSDTRTCTIG